MDERYLERQIGALRAALTSTIGFQTVCDKVGVADDAPVKALLYRANAVSAGLESAAVFLNLAPALLKVYPDHKEAIDSVRAEARFLARAQAGIEAWSAADMEPTPGSERPAWEESDLYDRCGDLAEEILRLFGDLGIAV